MADIDKAVVPIEHGRNSGHLPVKRQQYIGADTIYEIMKIVEPSGPLPGACWGQNTATYENLSIPVVMVQVPKSAQWTKFDANAEETLKQLAAKIDASGILETIPINKNKVFVKKDTFAIMIKPAAKNEKTGIEALEILKLSLVGIPETTFNINVTRPPAPLSPT